ncbi:MAG: ABC transporter permease subunit [Chloroflexia bacterium]
MSRQSMSNDRVAAILQNEWGQLLGNRVVIFTTLGPPLLLVIIALCALLMSSWIGGFDITKLNLSSLSPEQQKAVVDSLKETTTLQRDLRFALLSSFLVLFQMIPMVVPLSIASHSIVGEKQNRSLEPLLATPIRTEELLFAKAIAAAVPGIIATWVGFILFAMGAKFVVNDDVYTKLILGPTWLVSIVVLTPLFTVLTVGLSIIISSRVKDPNTAQQLGSLIILPLIGVLVGQMIGVVNSNIRVVMVTAIIMVLLDLAVLSMAVRMFKREEILTNWR